MKVYFQVLFAQLEGNIFDLMPHIRRDERYKLRANYCRNKAIIAIVCSVRVGNSRKMFNSSERNYRLI